jgi:CubicO group peptidase (beta-lactamase class C family)
MARSRSDPPPRPFAARLTRRRALIHAGAGLAALGAAGAVALPDPAAAQDATPGAAPPAAAEAPGTVTPARAALAVARVPSLAQEIMAKTGVPGMAVAVVFGDAVTFADGFGVRQLGKSEKIEADTVFQLASLSKPVASTVAAAVVGDGKLAWTSRLADVAPGFALREAWPTQEVTFADLFAHRSGLRDHAGDLLEDLGFGRDEVLRRLRYLEPAYSFRGSYLYTNFGLTAAAVAAAHVAGKSWEDLSAELLYRPLGMTHTSSRFADYMAESNRAIPHVKQGGTWAVTPEQRNPDAQTPAGGVSSTARELARWARLQLGQGTFNGRQLIPAEALAPTHVPQAVSQSPSDPGVQQAGFYGLGWGVGYDNGGAVRWSHSGAFALGAATAVYLLPGSGFGVLALTNGSPVGAPEALCLSVLDLAMGREVRDWLAIVTPSFVALAEPLYGTGTDWGVAPADATPARPDDAYLGTYRNDYYGDAAIVRAGSGLALRIGPKPNEFGLTHYDRDTYSWQPSGENATVRSGLTFTVGADGRASGLTDEYLASGGPGTLTRSEAAPR